MARETVKTTGGNHIDVGVTRSWWARTGREVYARCYQTLPEGGVLVNGDFIKPDGTSWDYEPGRFKINIHLDFLRKAGVTDPNSLAHLELNIKDPTAAQNYACLVAER